MFQPRIQVPVPPPARVHNDPEHTIHFFRRPNPAAARSAAALISLAAGAAALASSPHGAPPPGTPFISRTLLDHTLTPHAALVHRIDESTITWTDSRDLTHTQPIADFLALLPGEGPTGWQPGATLHTLALVDGQRFPGVPMPDDESAAADPPVAWLTDFAPLSIPLDAVASLTAPATPAPPPGATGDDAIRLKNGDSLAGFVLSLGHTIEIETDAGVAGVADVPLDLVAWARLANPPAPPRGPVVWLADGTVASIELLDQATPESLLVRIRPITGGAASPTEDSSNSASAAAAHAFPLAAIRALAFEPARLLPLGLLASPVATSDRPWTPTIAVSNAADQALGAPDITLPAPVRAAWVIPPTAQRLALTAVLPERARVWGDCELVITLDQDATRGELSRTRFHVGSPTAAINLELPPPADPRRDRRLLIELIAGPTGPAQDTLVLQRPLLLLAP